MSNKVGSRLETVEIEGRKNLRTALMLELLHNIPILQINPCFKGGVPQISLARPGRPHFYDALLDLFSFKSIFYSNRRR